MPKYTEAQILGMFVDKHGSGFDYSRVVYTGMGKRVTICCPLHGVFSVTPASFLKSVNGCRKCHMEAYNKKKRLGVEGIVNRANLVHENRYDYSLFTEYSDTTGFMAIICPDHGQFEQRVFAHLGGQGCPSCNRVKLSNYKRQNPNDFFNKCREVFAGKYQYTDDFTDTRFKITVSCPHHGDFQIRAGNHLYQRQGCPRCSIEDISTPARSGAEIEIADFLSQFVTIETSNRTILYPLEIDIYIPDRGICIEYCGLYWHNSERKPRSYHYDKMKAVQSAGLRLITVFEDEWIHHREAVELRLLNILGHSEPGWGGRRAKVEAISSERAKPFLSRYHLQGFAKASVHIGAFSPHGELIAVMSFGTPTRQQTSGVELKRFATDGRNHPGLAGKLFRFYIRTYDPDVVVSFSDNRWSDGLMYEKLGFVLEAEYGPDYSYIRQQTRIHKSTFRKKKLAVLLGVSPESMTEQQMAKELKLLRIYDCGKKRWVFRS